MKRAKRLRKPRNRTIDRRSAAARGYDRTWQKVRSQKLALDPLCQDCICKGRSTAAVDVHHNLKVSDRPDLRLDLENLRSLCKSCHSIRTAKGE